MRLAIRLSTILLAASSLVLVACGGGDDDGGGDGGGGTVDPNGTHYQFVADSIVVPASQNEATQVALDIDGDGRTDNALGGLLGVLSGQGLDVKTTVDDNVQNGTVIILADLQATSLTTATGVGMQIYLGDNPNPAACTDPADQATCGKHLEGGASFGISSTSPTDALLVGQNTAGTYKGGPGSVTLELPLAEGAAPVVLNLLGARIEVGVSETSLTGGKLGGAVTIDDIDNQVIPAIATVVNDLIARDCTPAGADCGCADGSTGGSVLGILDDADGNCEYSVDELKNDPLISSTLRNPDLDLLDADGNFNPRVDGEKDSLSLAVGFTGVPATFTP